MFAGARVIGSSREQHVDVGSARLPMTSLHVYPPYVRKRRMAVGGWLVRRSGSIGGGQRQGAAEVAIVERTEGGHG